MQNAAVSVKVDVMSNECTWWLSSQAQNALGIKISQH